MKKQIFAVGLFAAAIAMLTTGCSETPGNRTLNIVRETDTMDTDSSEKKISRNASEKTVRIGAIDWYVKYEDAMAAAKESNRPIWLHFGENPG